MYSRSVGFSGGGWWASIIHVENGSIHVWKCRRRYLKARGGALAVAHAYTLFLLLLLLPPFGNMTTQQMLVAVLTAAATVVVCCCTSGAVSTTTTTTTTTLSSGLLSCPDIHQNSSTGSTSAQGTYRLTGANVRGDAIHLTPAELVSGYVYHNTGAQQMSLVFPGAPDVAATLLARGISAEAGLRLQPVLVFIEATLVPPMAVYFGAGVGVTILGPGGVWSDKNSPATLYWVFSGPATADVFVVRGT